MANRQGRYTQITVSGVDISAYCDSVDLSMDVDMLETTTYTSVAKTYLPGLQDSKIDIKGKYDPLLVTGLVGSPVNLLPKLRGVDNSVPVRVFPGGNTVGQTARDFQAYVASYKESSTVGGIITFESSLQVTGALVASGI